MAKQDYLGECNNQKVPLEDFNLQFCSRCMQPECLRSQFGTSKFEQKVTTWEDRLFLAVPRMDPSDPRFVPLRSKKFVTIDSGPVPEVHGWVDPNEEVPPPVVESAPPVPPPSSPQPVNKVSAPSKPILNTPNRPGQMVGGNPPPQAPAKPPVAADPWQPKGAPNNPNETVVAPGARVRFKR